MFVNGFLFQSLKKESFFCVFSLLFTFRTHTHARARTYFGFFYTFLHFHELKFAACQPFSQQFGSKKVKFIKKALPFFRFL